MTNITLSTVAIAALLAAPAIAGAQPRSATPHHATEHAMNTIVQVARTAGNFSTLLAALEATGLDKTLDAKEVFTVFAPSDSAFAKLPAGTLESLLKDREKLASILTYHVLPGKITAADVLRSQGGHPATVNGQSLGITLRGGNVFVNGAQVIATDIHASNGVIHVIDSVLLPSTAPVPAGR